MLDFCKKKKKDAMSFVGHTTCHLLTRFPQIIKILGFKFLDFNILFLNLFSSKIILKYFINFNKKIFRNTLN